MRITLTFAAIIAGTLSLDVGAAEIHDAALRGDNAAVAALLKASPIAWTEKDKSGNQALHLAAQKGSVEVIEALLDAGADVNAKGFDDWTPLHYAAKSGSAEVCRALLEHGANREALNGVSRTPLQTAQGGAMAAIRDYAPKVEGAETLFAAIEVGDAGKVNEQITAHPATLKAVDHRGYSPLLAAVRKNHLAIADLLLKAGADVNARDRAGQSALAMACELVSPDLVALLFEHKITPARAGDFDELLVTCSSPVDPAHLERFTAEMMAIAPMVKKAQEGSAENRMGRRNVLLKLRDVFGMAKAPPDLCARSLKIATLLLQHGVDPNVAVAQGTTPLKAAAFNEDPAFTKLLLQHGAKPDFADEESTALSFAVIASRRDNIRLLLDAGAQPLAMSDIEGSPLLLACITGDAPLVKELMVAVKDRSALAGNFPLLADAALYGQQEIVRMLLDAGVSAAAKDEHNSNALHSSARSKSTDCTRMLIAAGADVNARDAAGYTPLANAVEAHRNEQVTLLLAQGARMDLNTRQGLTPLHIAGGSGFVDTMEILLKAGAKLDAVNDAGSNVLHSAAAQGRPAVVKALLQAGLPVDSRGKKTQNTPLLLAAMGAVGQRALRPQTEQQMGGMPLLADTFGSESDYATVAETLIAAGADVNAVNGIGMTPLHMACTYSQTSMARLLLGKGAHATARAQKQVTPLHLAANADLVTLLLENGAEMEATVQASKFTPVLSAAYAGNAASLERLLKHGANPHAVAWGQNATALHVAATTNRVEAAKVLLTAGLKIDALAAQKMTPLMVAVTEGHLEVATLLVEKGADVNARGARGISILQVALAAKRQPLVDLLVSHGAKE